MTSITQTTGFDSLIDDNLGLILEFVGRRSYASFGGINKECRSIYLASGMLKETYLYGYAPNSVFKNKWNNWEFQFSTGRKRRLDNGRTSLRDRNELDTMINVVVYYNRISLIHWAQQEEIECLLSGVCRVAVQKGRIDLLIEALRNNADGSIRKSLYSEFGEFGICLDRLAASHGQLDVLKWFYLNGFNLHPKSCALDASAEGHLHVLEWMKDEGYRLDQDKRLCNTAAQCGQLRVLIWLRDQGCCLNAGVFISAVHSGNINVLEWLLNQGCPRDEHAFNNAIEKGDIRILNWLRDSGCPRGDNRKRLKRKRVRRVVVSWLLDNGFSIQYS